MNFLMMGVFVFFGLHTALWLFRSLIEQAGLGRPPKKPQSEKEGSDQDEQEGENGSPGT
jgi:hypothetical protein